MMSTRFFFLDYYYLFFPFTFLLYLPHATRDSHSFMHCVHVLLQSADHHDFLSGRHNWYATSHARPTYCNVCREALSGKIYDRPSFFIDFKIQKFKSPPRKHFFLNFPLKNKSNVKRKTTHFEFSAKNVRTNQTQNQF